MEKLKKNQISKRSIFFGLVSFHLLISVFLSIIARSGYLSNHHNSEGIWNFAIDSMTYHDLAEWIARDLGNGMFHDWWFGTSYIHVRLISIFYYFITPDPLSFSIVNAAVWALGAVCIFFIAKEVTLCSERYAVLIAAIFSLWPSSFLLSTQLLKDPLYNLGCLIFILGWVSLLSGRANIRFALLILAGFSLSTIIRPEPGPLFLMVSVIAVLVTVFRVRPALPYAFLALILITGFSASHIAKANTVKASDESSYNRDIDEESKYRLKVEREKPQIEEIINDARSIIKDGYDEDLDKRLNLWLTDKRYPATWVWTINERQRIIGGLARTHGAKLGEFLEKEMEPWANSGWIPFSLERAIHNASRSRDSFLTFYADPSSFAMDSDILFRSIYEVIKYIPRAMQIGLFAPFPNRWMTESHTSGGASRLIAGMEMMILYVIYAGFVFYCVRSPIDWGVKLWMIIFCTLFILPLGLFVPNIGTLFRMRFVYLVPVLIVGLDGLRMMLSEISFQKRLLQNRL